VSRGEANELQHSKGVIEITPEMIEAGARILRLSSVGAEPCDGGRGVACDVLRAMAEASGEFLVAE
jgi:hypothetical protein